MLVEPPELLPENVLHALPRPVAVVLEGQQYQPGGAARTAHGLEENLGLEGEGTRVGVVVAVDDQDRLVDLVGEEGRRDLDVDIPGLEEGTALGLEAERLVGLVVRAAPRDAGPKKVCVRQRLATMSPPWLWPMTPIRSGSATPISTALATAASASATSWGTKVS